MKLSSDSSFHISHFVLEPYLALFQSRLNTTLVWFVCLGNSFFDPFLIAMSSSDFECVACFVRYELISKMYDTPNFQFYAWRLEFAYQVNHRSDSSPLQYSLTRMTF